MTDFLGTSVICTRACCVPSVSAEENRIYNQGYFSGFPLCSCWKRNGLQDRCDRHQCHVRKIFSFSGLASVIL